MLSSRLLNSFVLGFALLAAGCDRQTSEKAQPAAQAGVDCKAETAPGKVDRSRKGCDMPAVKLVDAGGKELDPAALRGKPVLINLWATWCAPCVAELPRLEAMAKKHAGAVTVLAVSQDSTDPKKVAEFLTSRGLNSLALWLDPKSDFMFALGGSTLPMTAYYDAEGKEVWRLVGDRNWEDAETDELLAEAD